MWWWLTACEPKDPPSEHTGATVEDTSPPTVLSWPDADLDGYGDDAHPHEGAEVPPGNVLVDGDCDDADPGVHPGAVELCDGRDEDCDGAVDAGGAYPPDHDGDGYGGPGATSGCLDVGFAETGGDCDDEDPARSPGLPEICGLADEDCDDLVDDADPDLDPSGARWFFRDADGDGYGNDDPQLRCRIVDGYTPQYGDCDDGDTARHPLAWELCNGVDDDCDRLVDDDDPLLPPWGNGGWFWDLDDDGAGGEPVLACDVPADGVVDNDDDCDDFDPDLDAVDRDGDGFVSCAECAPDDPDRFPRALEVCDGADSDCDLHPDVVGDATDVAGCDLCPLTRPDPALLERSTLNPCLLDPQVERLCQPGQDTHTSGLALHEIVRRVDVPERRRQLFLWLGDAAEASAWLDLAAWNGYTVLSLGYDTTLDEFDLCAGRVDACSGNVRGETSDGIDRTNVVEVTHADSIEGRLETVLGALVLGEPGEGWARWRTLDGEVRWEQVLVAGWNDGAGSAAWLAHEHPVDGALLLSGPKDRTAAGAPADWLTPGATPGCAMWSIVHRFEGPPAIVKEPMVALGIPSASAPILATLTYPPPEGEQVLYMDSLAHDAPSWCQPVDAVAQDPCLNVEGEWTALSSLLCLLGEPDDTCP